MRFIKRAPHRGALAIAGLAVAAIAMPGMPAVSAAKIPVSAATVPGPVVKLEAAQRSVTLYGFRGRVYLDPGIWVSALASPLEFDVQRASYTKPITITQIIHPPYGGIVRRPLPASILDGFNGLRRFTVLTVRNLAGNVVLTKPTSFCPNDFNPARVSPGGPPTQPYPPVCTFDPFQLGMVWGVQKGWAVDPAQSSGRVVKLPVGVYHVTETISPGYVRLFHIPAKDATATIKLTVAKPPKCCPPPGCCAAGRRHSARAAAAPPLPANAPTLTHPPASALPDLVPLPSWGIEVSHPRRQTHDYLDFGATVWIGGNGPLDVEGFRSDGSPTMKAYQYFWRNGHVIGRVRAGTMGFDSQQGHNHWHFEQFARYALLNSAKSVAVRSQKVGFCIAPSDPVNLLLPHAVWQPSFLGFGPENCGSPTALWVAEQLPLGWGDTYFQFLAGQSFDITHVPNGTYYVEVVANPGRVLYETTTRNDVSLRKVILGGTPGHRTVKVPAWHGIDPEP
jgi:hypothetical protein